MRKGLFTTVAIIALSIIIGGVAQAAPLIIKIAHEEPANVEESSAQASAVVFKNIIETESNGEMEVKIYAASSLGNQRDRMEQVKSGILQVNIASIGGIAPFYPPINAVDLPFAFPNHAVATRVFDGSFGEKIREDLLKKTGMRLLMVTSGGFYVLTNNKRPVHSVADMKGLKIRTMSVPSHIAMMESIGAAATPIPWDELYSSLQTGVVQGQHNPIPIIAIGNLQEVQKYAILTNHLYGADWWITNEQFYKGLNPNQRRIFINAIDAAKIAGEGSKLILSSTGNGVKFLKDAGLEVYSPTPEEMEGFREKSIPAVMKAIDKDLGAEGVALANALLEAVKTAEKELYQ